MDGKGRRRRDWGPGTRHRRRTAVRAGGFTAESAKDAENGTYDCGMRPSRWPFTAEGAENAENGRDGLRHGRPSPSLPLPQGEGGRRPGEGGGSPHPRPLSPPWVRRRVCAALRQGEGRKGHGWRRRDRGPGGRAGCAVAGSGARLPTCGRIGTCYDSARDPARRRADGPVRSGPRAADVSNGRTFPRAEEDAEEPDALRRHPRTGRPPGDPVFLARLEPRWGRVLRRQLALDRNPQVVQGNWVRPASGRKAGWNGGFRGPAGRATWSLGAVAETPFGLSRGRLSHRPAAAGRAARPGSPGACQWQAAAVWRTLMGAAAREPPCVLPAGRQARRGHARCATPREPG